MDFGAFVANPMASIGTALAGGITNALSQGKTNQANEDMANNQMNFQREMSDTAHQREVKDLRKAGLNPYLTSTGQGASTPSGASANLQAPQINLPDIMSYGISLAQLEQQQQLIDQGAGKLSLDQQNSIVERALKEAQRRGTNVNTRNQQWGAEGIKAQIAEEMNRRGNQRPGIFDKLSEFYKQQLDKVKVPKIKNKQDYENERLLRYKQQQIKLKGN